MSDALERLKQRQRPSVPKRDASLTPTAQPLPSAGTSTSRNLDTQKPKAKNKLDSPNTSGLEPLQTKQSTLRLEQGLSDRLQALCQRQGICREVLIEAMFEYCEQHPESLAGVLTKAQARNEHRQQVANLKRAKSMMERFGQSD